MITVEILGADEVDEGGAEVEIFCDKEGLAFLSKQIDFLLKGETHVHFTTPSWAGDELSESPLGLGKIVNHMKIAKIELSK